MNPAPGGTSHHSVVMPLALAALALAFDTVTLGGQQPPCDAARELATLIETVEDRATRVPLPGALVTAGWSGGEMRVRTDSAGKAQICAPAQRTITLRVTYRDFRTGTQTTSLTLARTTVHTFAVETPSVLVRGSVVDQETGVAVGNVAIRIANTPLTAISNADGKFYFDRVPLGDYSLVAEHISYAANSTTLNVRGEDLDAAIRLTPEAIRLQPITVTAFSRRLEGVGYYERQRRGVGTFIGRRQIEAMNVQVVSDLLRAVPSVRLIPRAARRNAPQTDMRGRGNCRFRFLVDGTRMMPDFEMEFVTAHAIEGIEVYNGLAEVPAPFKAHVDGGGGTCGVVAIWTRNGR